VLAVGSNPIVPPTPGIQNPKIFTLRTINDSQNILDFCVQTQAKSAIIVGGGFIGLEMAENLHHRGIKITIIEKYIHIMKIID
jgi:NAD(P)H-nitrite reductase large subunit